jgi:hypothetical protein
VQRLDFGGQKPRGVLPLAIRHQTSPGRTLWFAEHLSWSGRLTPGVNRLQIKWLQKGSTFAKTPVQIDHGVPTYIGVTLDPIYHHPIQEPGGPAEGRLRITSNNDYNQINDGTPNPIFIVPAFNSLMYPLQWSDIGSKLSEGPPFGSGYHLEVQVYPTYNIYVRNSDGSFTQVETRTQASDPSGNFSLSPYPPNSTNWIIP